MTHDTAIGAAKSRPANWRNGGGSLALVVMLSAVLGIWRSLDPLVATWSQQEYSHAWFILPLAALIFLRRFRDAEIGGATTPGIFLAVLALVLMVFAWATGSYTVSIDGAILGVIGFAWSSLGTRAMK